jgi:hypothetical protein
MGLVSQTPAYAVYGVGLHTALLNNLIDVSASMASMLRARTAENTAGLRFYAKVGSLSVITQSTLRYARYRSAQNFHGHPGDRHRVIARPYLSCLLAGLRRPS